MAPERATVVIVNHNAGSPRHGPNLRSYYVGKYLVRRGYAVHVFTSGFSHKYVTLPTVTGEITREDIDGVQYHWMRTRPYNGMLGRAWAYRQFAKKLPAAIHGHVPEFKTLICSSPPPNFIRSCHRIARERGARLLFDVRDLWPLTILEMNPAFRFNPYVLHMGRLERFAYSHSDGVVSALPCAEPHMRERGLPEGRFYCIENGTEITDPSAVDESELPDDVRDTLGRNGMFRVGFAGAFNRHNDVDTCLDAAELLRDQNVQFVLVGRGRERGRLAARARHMPNVRILPAVRADQLPWVLRRFDLCYVGLRARRIYQYGVSLNKIFEYMRAERPIISAMDAGNDPVAAAGCGTTVRPEDPRAVADAVIRFADMSPEERQRLGEAAGAYVRAHHTYDVLVDRWIDAVEGNPPPGGSSGP